MQALKWGAIVLLVGAGALFVWARFFSTKPQQPAYVWGKGRGLGTDFMDTSKANANVTPIKGNLEVRSGNVKLTAGSGWFGAVLAQKSSIPTVNPVTTQNKTIWGKA